MWKIKNGKLIHVKDESRMKFKNSISQSILDDLNELAAQHNTYSNYLLEAQYNLGVFTVSDDSNPESFIFAQKQGFIPLQESDYTVW